MPPVNRNNPTRAKSSDSRVSLMEFLQDFPDDATCLEWLWRNRYSEDGEHAYCPKCERVRVFKRYETTQQRQSWTCSACGRHLHPTAGTIFHKSSTSLKLWFYAIYLMSSTRCGISAKQLEREIGVNYKTALRMLRQIRTYLMAQNDEPLSGEVEMDETFIGGKPRLSDRYHQERLGWSAHTYAWAKRAVVFGAVERGGSVRAEVVPNSRASVLEPKTRAFVLRGSMVYTDEHPGYNRLNRIGYAHRRVKHTALIYVDGNIHTQAIEGFWGLLKNGIRGTYHSVSSKHLPTYLNEFVWRYNHRDDDRAQFMSLLLSATLSH
jgi:transposase